MMRLTLTASSSALFSTWCFVEEFGVLFDAGDGVSASLMQRSRKIQHIFVTHADRDHVAGLLQLHQLNARDGVPQIYFPRDCGSFPALKAFVEKFDPQAGPATWRDLVPGDIVEVGANVSVRAERSEHVIGYNNQTKALKFILSSRKRVLRSEYKGLSGLQIQELKKDLGPDGVTEEVREDLLGYSGDSPGLDVAAWTGVRILIHECTFLEPGTAKRAHANLADILEASRSLALEALVLLHFSARYSKAEIASAVERESKRLGLTFPVYVVVPGELCEDVLGCQPVWRPPP